MYNEFMSPIIREQILEYLRQNQTATVTELALALHITRQDIRYNLKPLLSEQLIEKLDPSPGKFSSGRGRPAARLKLTMKSRANNYAALAAGLLKYYLAQTSRVPDKAAAQLAKWVFKSSPARSSSAMQVINDLVEQLCSYEYQAHWEAHAAGPRIIMENCPYAEIINNFPELCSMDREFMKQFSGMRAELLQRFDKSPRIPPACIFKITL